jgi:tetratricopeptide (TPR) repeat protein
MLAILVVSALVYLPALRGMEILDDHVIATGAAIGGGKSFLDCFTHPFLFSYYRPLISVSFWAEMRLWGTNPFLLHQTNLLIHVLTTFLMIRLAGALGLSRKVSYLSGLFFALQPAQVGAVAWIGGRTDAQACLFFVVMLLAIVRYFRDGALWWIPLGVLAGLAAMLTKEQVAPAVLAAPLIGLAYRAPRRQLVYGSFPYLLAGAGFILFWFTLAPEHVKAPTVPLAEIFSQISRSTLNYTLLFVAPNPWSMNTYSLETLRSPLGILLGGALTILIPLGIWQLWKRAPRLGAMAVAGGLVYLPVSNLIPIPSLLAAPYRVALSGPCVAVLLAVAAGRLWQSRPLLAGSKIAFATRVRQYAVPVAAFGVLAAGLALVPWGASLHRDDVTLFGACSRYDSGSLYMRANYIWALNDKGQTQLALKESNLLLDQVYASSEWRNYEKAGQIMRDDPRITRRVLANHGARAEAAPMVSRYFVLHGQLLMRSHQDAEALRSMTAAKDLDETDDSALYGLGNMLLDRDPKRATRYLTKAISLNPNNTGAIYLLGHYYGSVGNYEMAYHTLARLGTSSRETGMPMLELAEAELRTGRIKQARETLQLASHMIIEPNRLAALETRAYARS